MQGVEATAESTTFTTSHSGSIHDVQLDYYGKLLASASSDHTIHLWDISSTTNEAPKFLTELRGHEGPVWQISWAHPKFGNLLASCSYDRRVIIWRGQQLSSWSPVYISEDQNTSVDTVQFSPWELGLHLAYGSADGIVTIISYNTETGTWSREAFNAHPNGVLCLSWCPANPTLTTSASTSAVGSSSSTSAGPTAVQTAAAAIRLATGGADNQVRVWSFADATNKWVLSHQMASQECHTRWVRDVAWRPNPGMSPNVVASCSDDGVVILWQEVDAQSWKNKQVIKMNGAVWKVSWSVTGAVLSVAAGTNTVSLFKENLQGIWEPLVIEPSRSLSTDISSQQQQANAGSTGYAGDVTQAAQQVTDIMAGRDYAGTREAAAIGNPSLYGYPEAPIYQNPATQPLWSQQMQPSMGNRQGPTYPPPPHQQSSSLTSQQQPQSYQMQQMQQQPQPHRIIAPPHSSQFPQQPQHYYQ